jgi:hypothetical protein
MTPAQISEIQIQILAPHSGASASGTMQVEQWDKRARTARAARAWGICWLTAIGAVFLPLLHFFLVPALLLAGPVAAFFIVAQENIILGGKGACPSCQRAIPFPRQSLRFPISDHCPHCQTSLVVTGVP